MHSWLAFLVAPQTLSLVLPALVFTATVVLVVRRLIGFFVTLLFLVFALGAGVVIANYDVVRTHLTAQHQSVQSMEGEFADLKRELHRVFEDIQADLKEQRQNARKVHASARDMLDEMDRQKASLREYVQESISPLVERAMHDSTRAMDKKPEAAATPMEEENAL